MKIYLTTETLGKGAFETVELNQRFESDNKDAAPAHHILRKAERIAAALNATGTQASIMIAPESAAESNRLVAEGYATKIWHLNEVKDSAAKFKALRKIALATA